MRADGVLMLDGVYCLRRNGCPGLVLVPAPTQSRLTQLVERISQRVGRRLERRGLIVRDYENTWLDWDGEQASPMAEFAGYSITSATVPALRRRPGCY